MSSRARYWCFADRHRKVASWPLALCAVASLLFLTEAVFFLFFRNVNQDEGWYLWAAKLVFQGKVPYRDFAYSQTPLLPYVYGLPQWAFGQGLYQGRLTSLLFAASTLFLGASLVQRLAPRITSLEPIWAVACYLLLQVTGLYAAAYDVAYTAPYAPAGCLLLLAFWVALCCPKETWRNILATSCLAVAVAIRLSCASALVPLGLYLTLTSQRRVRGLLVVLAATLVMLALACGPCFLASRGVVAYDIFGFHTDRVPLSWQLHVALVTMLETGRDFGVPVLLGTLGLLRMAWVARRARRSDGGSQPAAAGPGDEAANQRPTDRRPPSLREQLPLRTFFFGLAIFLSGRGDRRGSLAPAHVRRLLQCTAAPPPGRARGAGLVLGRWRLAPVCQWKRRRRPEPGWGREPAAGCRTVSAGAWELPGTPQKPPGPREKPRRGRRRSLCPPPGWGLVSPGWPVSAGRLSCGCLCW